MDKNKYNVVLDYSFHPQADAWVDHHETAMERICEVEKRSREDILKDYKGVYEFGPNDPAAVYGVLRLINKYNKVYIGQNGDNLN